MRVGRGKRGEQHCFGVGDIELGNIDWEEFLGL